MRQRTAKRQPHQESSNSSDETMPLTIVNRIRYPAAVTPAGRCADQLSQMEIIRSNDRVAMSLGIALWQFESPVFSRDQPP
jgi:hypothetical protein